MRDAPALPALLILLGLVGCGGNDETSSSSPSRPIVSSTDGTVELESDTDGDLAYTTNKYATKAQNGIIVVNFTNFVPERHDVVVEDAQGKIVGRTARITDWRDSETIEGVDPGTYTYFCSIPGHREAGMEGTLIVR